MSSYVIESVDEAAKKTRELLLPFDISTWSKLALIVLFTGGLGFGFPTVPNMGGFNVDQGDQYSNTQTDFNPPATATSVDSDFTPSSATGAFAASNIVYLGIAAFIGLILSMLFISSVFEFVYYRSLIDEKIRIRKNFSDNLNSGARYFNFRIIFTLIAISVIAGSIGLVLMNPLLILPMILLALPLGLLAMIFNIVVHDFVLLEMLTEDKKFLEALTDVFERVSQDWRNFGLYIVLKLVLGFLAGSALGVAMLFILVLVGIPMILIGGALVTVSEVLIFPAVIIGIIVFGLIGLYLTVPVKTFLYHYAISVYSELPE